LLILLNVPCAGAAKIAAVNILFLSGSLPDKVIFTGLFVLVETDWSIAEGRTLFGLISIPKEYDVY
jgi:hypothetical protein